MPAYGRPDDQWPGLVSAGKEFLQERGKLRRDTSYTEMSTVLSQRTGYPAFDFSQQVERAGMGHLLGLIVEDTYPRVGAMLSSIVIYLGANDAGGGFYQLAQHMGILEKNPSRLAAERFWVAQMNTVYKFFADGGRLA